MPERDAEVFSNPLPPVRVLEDVDDDAQPMTNEDFRKLLMTPRVPQSGAPVVPTASRTLPKTAPTEEEDDDDDDPASRRKKKKSYYAKLKKIEEERERELAQRYRDRARERRDGSNKDYEQTEIISTTADYRAVAPDAKSGESLAERRKQLIQESKYLGGDMEHTHLVKGLDYALLEKVRAEITNKEQEDDNELEEAVKPKQKEERDPEEQLQFKTKMGRNIFRALLRNKLPERNDLFVPGRMAYVVDLEDEFADSDIPTTLIRSKADCPTLEATTTLTTNDIVINKLTQILSYLRQGRREKKKLKKGEKGRLKEESHQKLKQLLTEDSIYGDIGDYMAQYEKTHDKNKKEKTDREKDRNRESDRNRDRDNRHRDRERDRDTHRERERGRDYGRDRPERDRRDRGREQRKSYFEKPTEEDDIRGPTSARDLVKSINDKYSKGWAPADIEREAHLHVPEEQKQPTKEDARIKRLKGKMEIDSYAECYPGMMESADAIDDSDDEVDYTKMDMGNKKGPVGRWDFETQEEYSDYMSNKEALPKAAFQYGVKMADGRKTRRTGPKDEKAVLDREWQKIQNIIAKRKQTGLEGAPYGKVSKY